MSAVAAPSFTSQPPSTTALEILERPLEVFRITAIVSFVALATFLGILFCATKAPLALGAAILSVVSSIVMLSTYHPRFPSLDSIKRLFSWKQPDILHGVGSEKERLKTIPRSPPPKGRRTPSKREKTINKILDLEL